MIVPQHGIGSENMDVLNLRTNALSTDRRLHRSQQVVATSINRINELQKTIDAQQSKLANCLNDNLAAVASVIQQLLDKPT